MDLETMKFSTIWQRLSCHSVTKYVYLHTHENKNIIKRYAVVVHTIALENETQYSSISDRRSCRPSLPDHVMQHLLVG